VHVGAAIQRAGAVNLHRVVGQFAAEVEEGVPSVEITPSMEWSKIRAITVRMRLLLEVEWRSVADGE
jgi:hypothetical protein